MDHTKRTPIPSDPRRWPFAAAVGRRRLRPLLLAAVALAAGAVALAAVLGPPPSLTASLAAAPGGAAPAALPSGAANPPWPQGCGLRIGVSIDRSNSIANDDPANPQRIRDAVDGLVEGLSGTAMEVAIWSFGTAASGYAGPNPIDDAPGSAIVAGDYPAIGFTPVATSTGRQAIRSTVQAIPFASAASPEGDRLKGWTDWEAGFGGDASGFVTPGATAPGGDRPGGADVLLFVTDGSPTLPGPAGDPDRWGADAPIEEGVAAADSVKAAGAGTRVVAIGVGSEVDVANLERISGGLGTSVPGDDYFFIADYQALLDTLLASIARSCGGAVEVVKQVPGTEPGTWRPSAGWPFTLDLDRQPPSRTPVADEVSTGPDGGAGWSWIGDGGAYQATVGEALEGRERSAGATCAVSGPNQEPGGAVVVDGPIAQVTVPNGGRAECEFRNYLADPRLELSKVVAPTRFPMPGGVARYEIQVANTSPQVLERIRLDALADDRFGDLLDPGNPQVDESTCPELDGSVLEPGAQVACTFAAEVGGTAAEPHRNVATVQGVELPPGGGDGIAVSAHDDAEVAFDPLADLAVTKEAERPAVRPGQELTYAVVAANLGPDDATGVVVVDEIDGRSTYVADTGGCALDADTLSCPIGDLAVGEERSFTVTVAVSPDADVATPLRNVVVVSGDQPDPEPANDRDEALTWLEVELVGEKRTAQVPAEVPDAGATYDVYETGGALPDGLFEDRTPPSSAAARDGWRWWARVEVGADGAAPVAVVRGGDYCFVEHAAPTRWVLDAEPRCAAVDGSGPGAPGAAVPVDLPEERLLLELRAHKYDALEPSVGVAGATYEVLLVEDPARPIHADWFPAPPPGHEPVAGLALLASATTDAAGDLVVEVPSGYAYCLREVEVPPGYRSDPQLRCTEVLDTPAQAEAAVIALPEVPDVPDDPAPGPEPEPGPEASPPDGRSSAPPAATKGGGGRLPVTGASVGLLLAAGSGLALGGTALARLGRRRRWVGRR
jgi:uncharacterized repeat protein (TIGR01451 family)